MAKVYLETSFLSACVTTRQDVASLYRCQSSNAWLESQAIHHELFASAEVLRELSDPRFPNSEEALKRFGNLPLLSIEERSVGFGEALVRHRSMPAPLAGDALHVA